MAKRDRSITCGDESFPCKKRLSFYHTLKKDLEYWEDNFEKEKEEEKHLEYIHRSEIQREIEENNRIDLVAKNRCTVYDYNYFDPNTSRTYYEESEEERNKLGKEIGEIARKAREARKNKFTVAKYIQEYGDFELPSL